MTTESEKPRQRVSNADRKVFANPEIFAISSLLAEEFPDTLQYKISRYRVIFLTGPPLNLLSVGQ